MNFVEKIINFTVMRGAALYGGIQIKRYYSKSKNADKINERLLMKLLKKSKNTEFGKKYDFANIRSVSDYQKKIPYTTYEDYKAYIDEMAETGRQGLLTAETVEFFAKTSGTTGIMKRIPVVRKAKSAFTRTVAIFVYFINREMKKHGHLYGKGLNMVEMESSVTKGGIPEGIISAYTIEKSQSVVSAITCIPNEAFKCGEKSDMKYIKAFYALKEKDLTYFAAVFNSNITDLIHYIIENQDILCNDIQNGKISDKIDIPADIKEQLNKKLRPDPKRAEELRKIFHSRPEHLMKAIWPKLCFIIGIGSGEFSAFTRKLKKLCGKDVAFFNETYSSSESLIATGMETDSEDYFLLFDNGFFEFIPIEDENSRPLMLHELKVGELYEIVITNLSGLYRYRIKDVVRVTGYKGKVPLLRFAYRKNQVINITGVKLTAEHITGAIKAFEKRTGIIINDYCLYPDTENVPWNIVLFMETQSDISPEMSEKLGEIFDEELEKMNREHGRMLTIGETSPSVVLTVQNGTFREFREYRIANGASQNQLKSIRVINTSEQLDFFRKHIKKVLENVK